MPLCFAIALLVPAFWGSPFCTCAHYPRTGLEARDSSSVAFVGTVLRADTTRQTSDFYPVHVRLLVEAAWKGAPTDTIDVFSGALCATHWVARQRYVVFASSERGRTITSFCAGTLTLSEAREVLHSLGAPRWRGRASEGQRPN